MPRVLQTTFLKPGDRAPHSGVYQITHRRHRAAHTVTVVEGDTFPSCQRCGEHVRYHLLRKGELPPHGGQRSATLLLVDPENTVSFTLKQILESSGYEVSTAPGYRAAAEMLRQRAFDVVLTEVDLERSADGLQLALEAKQLQPQPVVILSASQPTQQGLRAALGLANYLVFKPIDLNELQNALDTMVSRRAVELSTE